MKLVLVLAVAAALGLAACGAGDDTAPAESAESPEPQAALPDVARVVCAVHGTRLETDAVKPQPDGIHLEVVNETGEDRSVSALEPQGGGGLGQSAPAGTSTLVVALAPGTLEITCADLRSEEEPEGSLLEVVDEDGVWISTTLDCTLGFSGTSDYTPGARGDADPLAAAQSGLESYMQPGDVVEPAGYPVAEIPLYRLVRDGEVLATVELQDDGAGGWLPSTVEGCSTLTD
jgi:hypothetical protein